MRPHNTEEADLLRAVPAERTPQPPPQPRHEVPSPWRTVRVIGAETAVLIAVLFYFGWASSRETFRYFGIDLSLLGFGTSDLLLRSIYPAYQPLLCIGLVALACVCLHQALMTVISRNEQRWRTRVQRLPYLVVAVGTAVGTSAVIGLLVPPVGETLGQALPALLGIGALMVAYGDHLSQRTPSARFARPR